MASEVDPTKEDVNDEQARLILKKYGAYIDEKRTMVDERVDAMMARRGTDIDNSNMETIDPDE